LVTFPDDDDRQRLVDLTRTMPRGTIRKMVREIGGLKPTKKPS